MCDIVQVPDGRKNKKKYTHSILYIIQHTYAHICVQEDTQRSSERSNSTTIMEKKKTLTKIVVTSIFEPLYDRCKTFI